MAGLRPAARNMPSSEGSGDADDRGSGERNGRAVVPLEGQTGSFFVDSRSTRLRQTGTFDWGPEALSVD